MCTSEIIVYVQLQIVTLLNIISPSVFSDVREVIDVKFPKSSEALKLRENYFETEKRMKETKWKKERMWEDM